MVIIKCCVPECVDKSSTRHRFPYLDEKLYNIWISVIGKPILKDLHPQKVYEIYRICDRHFSNDCHIPGWKKLKPGSTPTLYLPDLPNNSVVLPGNISVADDIKCNAMGKAGCAVFGCVPSKIHGRHKFVDPNKNLELFKKWLVACHYKQLETLSAEYIWSHYRVCSKHFTKESFGPNNSLKKDALPTLFLPDSPVTHQDNQLSLSNKLGETTSNNHEVISSSIRTYNVEDKLVTDGDESVRDDHILHRYKILLNKPNSQVDDDKEDDPSNISIVESSPIIIDDDNDSKNDICNTIQVTTPERKDVFFLTPENISTICRICLKQKDVVQMFENKYEELSYAEILEMCSSIKLKEDETLSQYICQSCFEELIQVYNFRIKCNKSEQILLNFKTELSKGERRKERVYEKLKSGILSFHDYENILSEEEINYITNYNDDSEINKNDETKQQILKKRFYLLKGDLSGKKGFKGNVDVKEIDESSAKTLITNNHQTTVSLKVGNAICNVKTAVVQGETSKSGIDDNVISSDHSNTNVRNPIKRRKIIPNSQMIRRAIYSLMNCRIPNINSYPLKKRRPLRKGGKQRDRKVVIPGVCEVCNETYGTMEEYKQHTKATKHYLNPYVCKSCGKVYPDKYRLKIHWNVNHENNKSYMCEKCGKCYKTRSYLMSHLKSHGQKNYVCSACDLSCSSLKEVVNHRKANHPLTERKHCCEYCGEVFTRYDTLRQHRNRRHLKIRRHFCHICGKGYPYKSSLKKHIVSHADEQYDCQLCNKSFKMEQGYLKHIKIQHPGTDKNTKEEDEIQMMKCIYCNFACRNKQLHSMHIKDAHDAIICIYCDTLFDTDDELKNHIESSHVGIVDFSCRYCGKSFLESHMFYAHLDIHRMKHFQCQLCFKKFSSSVRLKIHMVVHTQEKMYKCQYCEKAFHYSTSRVIHERYHTGERPYVCDICGKGNVCLKSYKKHRATHKIPSADEIKLIESI